MCMHVTEIDKDPQDYFNFSRMFEGIIAQSICLLVPCCSIILEIIINTLEYRLALY
jgi:hypothetical protein